MKPTRSWWRRLWQQVVPTMPDFYGLLEEQADNLRATVAALADYLEEGDEALAPRIRALVEQGHGLRSSNLDLLHRTFVTPIDREDIYDLVNALDHILDYVENTVREVEVLRVPPDDLMRRMTAELGEGVASLALALARFHARETRDAADTVQTREAERRVEDLYRDALANMFQGQEYQELSTGSEPPSVLACLDFVMARMKRREVYRHLSNAADRLARAGEILRDICIKYDEGGTGIRRTRQ